MKNKQQASFIFLILGLISLAIGIGVNNTVFSFAAIVFVLISLILGGRWMRPRRK